MTQGIGTSITHLICNDILHICSSVKHLTAPQMRLTILQQEAVLPLGSLGSLPEFNYDMLSDEMLGIDSPPGHEQTLIFLARYGLIGNSALCRNCQSQRASLVKDTKSSESYIVSDCTTTIKMQTEKLIFLVAV